MLLSWMAYAWLFAAVVAIGAMAADRTFSIWRRATRGVWVTALIASAVIPVTLALSPRRVVIESIDTAGDARWSVDPSSFGAPTRSTTAPRAAAPAPSVATQWQIPASWNRTAGMLWLTASVLLLAMIARSFALLRRRHRSWARVQLDGLEVLVAHDVGPAVAGVVKPSIVLPEWALRLEGERRRMMLRHEMEHIRAGDPYLLFAATLLVALLPWNLPLLY